MIETKKSTIAYWKIVSCLVVFSAMFIFNFIFPIEKSLLPFYSITNRAWHWCEILISGLSVYYIFKIRTLNFMDLVVSCVLGFTVCPHYGYISGISTTLCYYSACQIFRRHSLQNKFFDLKMKDTVKSFFKGCLYSLPFALINNLAIYLTYANKQIYSFDISNVLPQVIKALAPGISEEVIWHFFLLAFVIDVFEGKIPKNKLALLLTYLLTVIPHCLIHLPNVILDNPSMALFQLLFTATLFGFPMAWIVKNKNLQTSIGLHWSIDFLRWLFMPW